MTGVRSRTPGDAAECNQAKILANVNSDEFTSSEKIEKLVTAQYRSPFGRSESSEKGPKSSSEQPKVGQGDSKSKKSREQTFSKSNQFDRTIKRENDGRSSFTVQIGIEKGKTVNFESR